MIDRIYHLDRGYEHIEDKLIGPAPPLSACRRDHLRASKGRIPTTPTTLLRTAGIDVLEDPESSRKLILPTQRDDVRVLVRASDVPTYVQQGGADIGISGKDVLMEQDTAGLYEPLDLNIAKCRLMVAVRNETDYEALVQRGRRPRVATGTSTPRAPTSPRRAHVDLIALWLHGAGPLVGMADAIVDVVSSGATPKPTISKP